MPARKYLRSGLVLTIGSVAASLCSFVAQYHCGQTDQRRGLWDRRDLCDDDVAGRDDQQPGRRPDDRPGDRRRESAVAGDRAGFQVFRGLFASVVLFAIAGPVALLFKIPEVTWAFRLLAVVPLIRSFAHFDIFRLQRQMRFGPSVWADAGPQVVTVILAAPLAMWLGDYRVMLFLVLLQVTAATFISHLTAKRPYRWAWDRVQARRIINFGWPLLINGLLMFFILQGDRAIVGAAFDMQVLGWYSAAFALTLMPVTDHGESVVFLYDATSREHARQSSRVP